MRKYISTNLIEPKYLTNQVLKNTEDIKLLQESLEKLKSDKRTNGIFFEGQIYDAYSLLLDILNTSKESITIIDNKILHHSGTSFKDVGKKCFTITKRENVEWLDNLIKEI